MYVKIFYLRKLDNLVASLPPGVKVDMYIDDLAVSGSGATDTLVESMVEAWHAAREALTGELGCRIANSKSRVVASSSATARTIAKRLGLDCAVRRCAPNLGIDATAGARRRIIRVGPSSRKVRLAGCIGRGRKLARIAKTLGSRAVKIFSSGIAPEANYGSEVWGVSDAEVVKLRRAAARALRPWSRCRSLTTVHLVHGLPTCKDELRTVVHLSKQIWRAVVDRESATARGMDLPTIRQLWEAAFTEIEPIVRGYAESRRGGETAAHAKAARRAWDAIRGPVGAAALTLARVGWSFKSAFVLADANGEEVLLTVTPPAMLEKMLVDASKDECERLVARQWAKVDPSFVGRRVCVDLAVKAIRSGVRDGLTPMQVGALRASICNGIYTRSRAKAEGYEVVDECPACGAAGDTPHHRVYGCPHTEDAVLKCVPRWLYDEGRRASPNSRFWVTASFPHPGDDWPKAPAVIRGEWIHGDGGALDGDGEGGARAAIANDALSIGGGSAAQGFGGYVYGDGSCEPNDIRGLERAAVAILEATARGELVSAFSFPLPRLFPQTSQASEYVMVAQARRMLTRRGIIHSDCLNVVKAATGSLRRALAPSRLYAGVNLDKAQMLEQDRLVQDVVWVKSHRAARGTEDEATLRDIKGNAEADRLAKAAVKAHDAPTALQRANLDFFARRAPLVAKAVATALAAFPSAEPDRLKRAAAPRSAGEAERRRMHWWRYEEGNWRCQVCGKWSTGADLDLRRRTEQCLGPKAEAEAKTWVGWGHRISVARGAVPIAFCTKCGAWGNRRALKLRAACSAPTAAGVAALKNIAAGKYPWQRRLPQGGCAPRPRLKVVATYVENKDAWAPTEDQGFGAGAAAEAQPQAETLDARATSGHVRADCGGDGVDMQEMEYVEENLGVVGLDDDDPFGHGGSLDGDEGRVSAGRWTLEDAGGRTRRAGGSEDARDVSRAGDAELGAGGCGSTAPHGPTAEPSARERMDAIRMRLHARIAAARRAAEMDGVISGMRHNNETLEVDACGVGGDDVGVDRHGAAKKLRTEASNRDRGSDRLDRGAMMAYAVDTDCQGAEGSGTVKSAVGARAVPGGPHLDHVAAAASLSSTGSAAAVVEGCGAAILAAEVFARGESSPRGEAATAPPQRFCRAAGRLNNGHGWRG